MNMCTRTRHTASSPFGRPFPSLHYHPLQNQVHTLWLEIRNTELQYYYESNASRKSSFVTECHFYTHFQPYFCFEKAKIAEAFYFRSSTVLVSILYSILYRAL